jgi:SAM-dependent methyltransferase
LLKSSHSRVLEIGCGAGGAIGVFQQNGFEAFGCDYSRELIEFGTSQGIGNLTCGTVDSIGLPHSEGDKFDLIYLHHVLEHVGQPFDALQRMQNLLKSDGRILIIVPDLFRIETHRKAPNDCMELFHVAHKWNFTRECLSYFASKLGMYAIDIQPLGSRTAWSEATEFWVYFQKQHSDCALTGPSTGVGLRYLDYLRRAEQKFADSLIAIAPTTSQSMPLTVAK